MGTKFAPFRGWQLPCGRGRLRVVAGERQPQDVLFVLECGECGERDARGIGWRAYLDGDDEVWIYCPECSEREFGDE